MSWNIVYTAGARRDLREIYEYIAYDLFSPETAAGQTKRIILVFYLPDESKNMVSIVRIMYSGRDARGLLNETKIES